MDYDTNITNVAVSCTAAEYADSTGDGSLSAGSGVTLTAVIEEEVLLSASPALTESNINGGTADITLVGMTFADAALDKANFTVSGAPLTVSGVSYTDDTHCALTLAYSGGDFDTDKTFSVTVAGAELSLGSDFITNTLTVTAVNDAESLSLSGAGITEGAENSKTIIAAISGGQFAGVITPANWTVSNLPAGVTKGAISRVDNTHVSIMLSGNAAVDYDTDITNVSVTCTAGEYTDSTGGGGLMGMGVTFTANNDAESLSLSGSATEGSENGAVINAAIAGGTFNAITPANWTVTGLPDGVSVGAVSRTDNRHVAITLAGSAAKDYDSDITNVTVSCTSAEYSDSTGALSANTGFTIRAVNDAENLSISGDGLISEGAEDGEVITAVISGGQFASTITPSNWTVAGLPGGVSKGTVTRVDDHHISITLSGNAANDYDNDITNVSVSCTSAEYEDNTGGGNLTGTGVTFTATNDAEALSLSSDGSIAEGAENGEIITATITGGKFTSTITPANWTVSGLPGGVTKGAVTRMDDTHVSITMSGNATVDYDTNITGVTVSCTAAEYADSTGSGSLTGSGVTFTASNDAESLSISSDGSITEGHEDGELITVTITGGQFASSVTPANWMVSGLPGGVIKGAVTRVNSQTVTIALSGNAADDYDIDITSVSVSCTGSEYIDSTGGGSLSASGITLTAVVEPEVILSAPAALDEGSIDGAAVSIMLKGMNFADTVLDKLNYTAGAPFTVSDVSYIDATHCTLTIAYSGADFDSTKQLDITVAGSELSAGAATKSNSLDVAATDDAESLSVRNDGLITEGAENGEVITAAITGGTFASTITPANWTVTGLPEGVVKGSVTRLDDHRVCITLSGNSAKDYDSDIANISVSCAASEYSDNTGGGSLSASGISITAVKDEERLSASSDGLITEGAENGEVITLTITGGTFAGTVTPANWTVTGLPEGVVKGAVTRLDDHRICITLSGNAAKDFDSDITNVSVSCAASEYSDNTGGGSLSASGITITAVKDEERLSISSDGLITEGAENGKVVTVAITGGKFAETITPANWTVTGLPGGIVKGSVTRLDDHRVCITLSGNAAKDYDSDITNVSVSCAASEYMDNTGGGSLSALGITLTAVKDEERLSVSGDVSEGEENGAVITVNLSGGQFSSIVSPANWTVSGLPAGVSKGTVRRGDDTHVYITLLGNARWDYDRDLDISITCTAAEYTDSTGGGSLSASLALSAVNDPELLTIHDDGNITEGAEDGEVITVLLAGGQFTSSLDPDAWTVENLPDGVSMGRVTRIDDNTVRITLTGNATEDYDSDIANVSVTCAAGQYVSGTQPLTALSGVVLKAIAEPKTTPEPTLTPAATYEPSAEPSSTQTPVDNARTITGILLDSNGNPMAGYIVELHSDPVTTVTDANGCYTFYNVEYTDHTLIAKTPKGEEIASFRISFSQGDGFGATMTQSGANITYTPSTVSVAINVTVSSDESGAAISQVTSVSNTETGSSSAWWIWAMVGALAVLAAILIIWFARMKNRKNSQSI